MRPLACAVLLLAALPILAEDMPVATILGYHEVDGRVLHYLIPRRSATNGESRHEQLRYVVEPDNFIAQLDYLQANGYNVIPLADLVGYLSGTVESLPPRAVVITVDDGWLCSYTHIWPEMRKRQMPWTLFVYPHIVGYGVHAVKGEQLAEMARDGVDVQSHSYNHPFLTDQHNAKVTPETYPAFLEQELGASQKEIEKKVGKDVQYICYPFGDYDDEVIAAAMKHGYIAGLTTERGVITRSTPPFRLKRYLMHNDTTLEEFKSYLLPAAPPATPTVQQVTATR
jgi:peptidoglycan/xylan/chitin deacetylase (PgdA/CDA1 family)